MSIKLPMNFDLNSNQPLDSRMIVSKMSKVNIEIPRNRRYAGMIVFMSDMNAPYWLDGDLRTWHELLIDLPDYDAINDQIIKVLSKHTCCGITFPEYTITSYLGKGIYLSNDQSTATRGTIYKNTITEKGGCTIDSIAIIMDGEDITSQVYNPSTKAIRIVGVTGDIEIEITSTFNPPECAYIVYSLKQYTPIYSSSALAVEEIVVQDNSEDAYIVGDEYVGQTIYKIYGSYPTGATYENSKASYESPNKTILAITDLFIGSDKVRFNCSFRAYTKLHTFTLHPDCDCNYLTNTDFSYMFYMDYADLGRLTNLNLKGLVNKNVKNLSYMFAFNGKLTNLNIDDWDTSGVTNMKWMFHYQGLSHIDFDKLDTSNVTSMEGMFYTTFSLDLTGINKLNTSNVTSMKWMCVYNKSTNIDLTGMDTSKCTNFSRLFSSNDELRTVDMRGLTIGGDLSEMFWKCSRLRTIDMRGLTIRSDITTNITDMFIGCLGLTRAGVLLDGCDEYTVNKINIALSRAGIT